MPRGRKRTAQQNGSSVGTSQSDGVHPQESEPIANIGIYYEEEVQAVPTAQPEPLVAESSSTSTAQRKAPLYWNVEIISMSNLN